MSACSSRAWRWDGHLRGEGGARAEVHQPAGPRGHGAVQRRVLVGTRSTWPGASASNRPASRPPAAAEERRLALDGIKMVLAEAGMTMDDLVSVQVFCTDLSLFDTWNGSTAATSARTFRRAPSSAGSLLRGGRFEIQAIASGGDAIPTAPGR